MQTSANLSFLSIIAKMAGHLKTITIVVYLKEDSTQPLQTSWKIVEYDPENPRTDNFDCFLSLSCLESCFLATLREILLPSSGKVCKQSKLKFSPEGGGFAED